MSENNLIIDSLNEQAARHVVVRLARRVEKTNFPAIDELHSWPVVDPSLHGVKSTDDLSKKVLRILLSDTSWQQQVIDVAEDVKEANGPGFVGNEVITISMVTTACLILLSTQAEFKRGKDGRWSISVVKPSVDHTSFKKILSMLLEASKYIK